MSLLVLKSSFITLLCLVMLIARQKRFVVCLLTNGLNVLFECCASASFNIQPGTIDYSKPQHDGRVQAVNVTGISGTKLLCDLNVIPQQAMEPKETNNTKETRGRKHRSGDGGNVNNVGQANGQRRSRSAHRQPTSATTVQ